MSTHDNNKAETTTAPVAVKVEMGATKRKPKSNKKILQNRIPKDAWLEMVSKMGDNHILHLAEQNVELPSDVVRRALPAKRVKLEEPGEGEVLVPRYYFDTVLGKNVRKWVVENQSESPFPFGFQIHPANYGH